MTRLKQSARDAATFHGESWSPVAALAFGMALAMTAYFPAQLGDRYHAVVTLTLGLGWVAAACAMAAYRTGRRFLGRAAAIGVGCVAAIPVLSAVLMPTGNLAWVAYYVCAIGLGSAVARPTAAATVFGLLSLVPLPFYFVFGRVFGQASM